VDLTKKGSGRGMTLRDVDAFWRVNDNRIIAKSSFIPYREQHRCSKEFAISTYLLSIITSGFNLCNSELAYC
jgi:hypothetical protein